jgi:hypothetical protein
MRRLSFCLVLFLVFAVQLAAPDEAAAYCERCKQYLICSGYDNCWFDERCDQPQGRITWVNCCAPPQCPYCQESGDICRWASHDSIGQEEDQICTASDFFGLRQAPS